MCGGAEWGGAESPCSRGEEEVGAVSPHSDARRTVMGADGRAAGVNRDRVVIWYVSSWQKRPRNPEVGNPWPVWDRLSCQHDRNCPRGKDRDLAPLLSRVANMQHCSGLFLVQLLGN